MARKDVVIRQGATWKMVFRVRDDGTDRDLTGYAVRMQVRATHATATTLLSVDTSSLGGITVENAIGRVTIEIPASSTVSLPSPSLAVYDVEIESGSGVVERVIEGVARITPEVTR